MAKFSINPHRFDLYKQFKFRVKWDERYVAGISSMSALSCHTEVVEHRDGGEPNITRQSPGTTIFEPIILERGITRDDEFEKWANKVWRFSNSMGRDVSLMDFRKDVVIELYSKAGQLVKAFKVYRCWPSEYVALSDLNANGEAGVTFDSITLQNEGWERDLEFIEPTETSI
jgi:phage tail-like protein